MHSTQREEFEAQLAALYGAWGRTPTDAVREGFWKGLELMSLADFARCVGKAIQGYTADSTHRLPDVGAIWALKRSLRAIPAITHEIEPTWQGDNWAEAANRHLLTYIRTQTAKHHRRYAPNAVVDVEAMRRTKILVEAKNRWAQIMRESVEDGRVDSDTQQAIWADQMQQAEREIDALTAAVAA